MVDKSRAAPIFLVGWSRGHGKLVLGGSNILVVVGGSDISILGGPDGLVTIDLSSLILGVLGSSSWQSWYFCLCSPVLSILDGPVSSNPNGLVMSGLMLGGPNGLS